MIICRIDSRVDKMGTQLILLKKIGDKQYLLVEDEWKELSGYAADFKPTIFMRDCEEKEVLQAMLDELISKGYRPSQIKLNDKELQATQYHLEDMRKLIFQDFISRRV